MKNAIAVVGIHTGIGKTVVSAILAESLQLDYWKPVQAGDLDHSDSKRVQSLLSNLVSIVHPEAFRLQSAMSPHEAARLDGVAISIEDLVWPKAIRPLLVETAGGIMSPVNEDSTVIDFVSFYSLPVVLVVRHYLGSISHTVMAIETLRARKVKILGMIINGQTNTASERFIESYSPMPVIARLPELPAINAATIGQAAKVHRRSLLTLLEHVNP